MNQSTLTKKVTGFQRIKRIILGREKPIFLVRISVISGFVVWLYLFSWHLLSLLSLFLFRNLNDFGQIISHYNTVGKTYGFTNTITRLKLHSGAQVVIYLVILAALILIWRRKKTGIILLIAAYTFSLLVSFIFMGFKFMQNEIGWLDYTLILCSILYFSAGLVLFFRNTNQQS